MSLTIEKTFTLSDPSTAEPPLNLKAPFILQEPDGKIYLYGIDENDSALDKNYQEQGGVYENVMFKDLNKSITSKEVSAIGGKHFPGIGAIGFYTDKHSGLSNLVIPVHEEDKHIYPDTAITITPVENGIQYSIQVKNVPESVHFSCFRISFRQGDFSEDSIVYNLTDTLPLLKVKGAYKVTVQGYDEEHGLAGNISPEVDYNQETGANGWGPAATV